MLVVPPVEVLVTPVGRRTTGITQASPLGIRVVAVFLGAPDWRHTRPTCIP